MRKKIGILLILICLTGCSVFNFSASKNKEISELSAVTVRSGDITDQNISGRAFFIQKTTVEIVAEGIKQDFLASVKYNVPDSFLISVRSRTGIEVARIFFTSDTIFVNDRMNKIFYYGSNKNAREKYGFDIGLFPLFFGDVMLGNQIDSLEYKCNDGYIMLNSYLGNNLLKYSINCGRRKSDSLGVSGDEDIRQINFFYSDYMTVGGRSLPEKVCIKNIRSFEIVNLRFSKVEIPWSGNISFIPGKNYEQIEIK